MALAAAVEGDWGCGLLLFLLVFWLEADDKADRTHHWSFLHVAKKAIRTVCLMVFAAETNAGGDSTPSRIYVKNSE